MDLAPSEISFLKDHNITAKDLFNAQGYSSKEYRVIMKELNKKIAYNATPCQKEGHRLRTRSGHCCQCNTAVIEFQKRNDSSGFVYIAGSLKGKLIKIGFTKAVEVRSESLNRTTYAGYKDWKILFAAKSNKAGIIENKSNSTLHKYAFGSTYEHDGKWQESTETYHCSYSKAKEIVINISSQKKISIVLDSRSDKYEFKNLIQP